MKVLSVSHLRLLLLSKVRDLENFGSRLVADPHVICLSQSEAQNREGIRSRSGADPLPKSCDLSKPIRCAVSPLLLVFIKVLANTHALL